MQLLQALRNAVKRLEADFEDSKLFTHSGDKGEFREHIVNKFLRPLLPICYGIGSGQIFSADGSSSDQQDLVLYDETFSNVLFRDSNNSLFPCESVFGTIEVKSKLSTEELENAIDNIASVKKLPRASSDMLDFLPFRRINLDTRTGLGYNQEPRNPYLGVIFAYDGLTADSVGNVLHNHIDSKKYPREHLPDFVFLYKRGATLLRVLWNGAKFSPVACGRPFTGYCILQSGSDTLPLFYLTLNTILNQLILRAPDFNEYWRQVVNQIVSSQPQPQQQPPPLTP